VDNETFKSKILNRKIANKYAQKLSVDLIDLNNILKKEYQKGAFKYQYMPPHIKQMIDEITTDIITKNPDIAKEYSKYIDFVKEQT
ncbi:MAG: hypothetical protein RSE93_07375, partial [Oscillospiraceae bacterium]